MLVSQSLNLLGMRGMLSLIVANSLITSPLWPPWLSSARNHRGLPQQTLTSVTRPAPSERYRWTKQALGDHQGRREEKANTSHDLVCRMSVITAMALPGPFPCIASPMYSG